MVRIFITSMASATPLPDGMVGGGGGGAGGCEITAHHTCVDLMGGKRGRGSTPYLCRNQNAFA